MEVALMLLLMLLPGAWIRASRRGNRSYQSTAVSSREDWGVSPKHAHAPSHPDTSDLNFRRTNDVVADLFCGLQTDCIAGAGGGEVEDGAGAEVPAQGGRATKNWALLQTAWRGSGVIYYWSSICSHAALCLSVHKMRWPGEGLHGRREI